MVVPAVIPNSFAHLSETLTKLAAFTHAAQVDIVDGRFVPSISWPYHEGEVISELATYSDTFDLEVDLMVLQPEAVIDAYVEAGVKRVVVHIESTEELTRIIANHASHSYALGLALNNETPLSKLNDYVNDIDFVQLMGIAHIGAQGEAFDDRVLSRIRALRTQYPNLEISVDGSVNKETLPSLLNAGAQRLISGSAILEADDPETAFAELQQLEIQSM